MRHRSIAALLAVLAMLALASVAAAGGWAQVTAKDVPADPPVGEETTIRLDVLQHGVTPVSWPGLTVVARDSTTGTVIRAAAQPVGPEGSYVAKLTFPSAGDWTLTYESEDLEMAGSSAIHIAPVAAGPGAGTATGEAAPAAQAFDALPLVFAALAAIALLAAVGLALRNRGAPADARVSART